MTEVIIEKSGNEKVVEHKIGNWYKHKKHGIFILANVRGSAVLIRTNGDFFSHPVSCSMPFIEQNAFDAICGSEARNFTLIDKITITEG